MHGDPGIRQPGRDFVQAPSIAVEVAYTGLEAAPAAEPSTERYDVVVSAGGGAAGRLLVEAAVAAARVSDKRWCLITGPNLPQADFDAAAGALPANVGIFRSRDFLAVGGGGAVGFASRLQHGG